MLSQNNPRLAGAPRGLAPMIFVLFFASGTAALGYEVVWSRYLALLFGSTAQAQAAVLAIYMGGLAIGSRLFGRWSGILRRPLLGYGVVEIIIGIYAFSFYSLYEMADGVFVQVGGGLLEQPRLLLGLKGAVSLLLLACPTILMGGTLPLLSAWLQDHSTEPGRMSARLYSINSLGAVLGAALTAFWFIPGCGLGLTLWLMGLINLLAGCGAVWLAFRQKEISADPHPARPTPTSDATAAALLWRGCVLVGLTGAISMGLEVLASRALALIFGASTHAFAIMLISFIFGISLGSLVVSSPKIKETDVSRNTVLLIILAACWLGIFVFGIEKWIRLYGFAESGFAPSRTGYVYHLMFTALVSIIVIGGPACLMGSVLPLWMGTLTGRHPGLADRMGWLLACNTWGAVAGALVTGFVLMPRWGLRGTLCATILFLIGIAWMTAMIRKKWITWGMCSSLLVLFLCASWMGGEGWRHTLSSGLFRQRQDGEKFDLLLQWRKEHIRLDFYEDAPDATVSVERNDGVGFPSEISLRINGKPDASSHSDLSTQYLLAHLPMMARPQSRDVFILGFGSGITAGALLGHPMKHLGIAENCAPVLRAGRLFEPWNRKVLQDSRVHVWNEDARTVLKLSPTQYDVIISEPSNPWMAGVGGVFSFEFYTLASQRLKEGGIMAQWFHIYETDDSTVALVLRTFHEVFPCMEVWDVSKGDIILLGSKKPWDSSPDMVQSVFARDRPRADLLQIGLSGPDAVCARRLASQQTAPAIFGFGDIQTDECPILEYEAPRAFFMGNTSRLLMQFDERTWKTAALLPRERRILASLDDSTLRAIFQEYSSINPDLLRFLARRLAQGEGGASNRKTDSGMPCVFQKDPPHPRLAQ